MMKNKNEINDHSDDDHSENDGDGVGDGKNNTNNNNHELFQSSMEESIHQIEETMGSVNNTDHSSNQIKQIQVNHNEFYEFVTTNNNKKENALKQSDAIASTTKMIVEEADQNISTTTSIPIESETTTKKKTHFRSKLCGVRPLSPTGRVVGGRNAQFGEWPWQVLIKEKSWLGFFTKSKCGGVLIDYKWILTAAHCQPSLMSSLIVMLGQHDLFGVSRQLRPVVKTVRRMIIHRDFDPDTFDNDIALLELDSPFEMQPHIVPICLPNESDDYRGQFAFVAGWGKLSYGGTIPHILQTVRLPIIGNRLCQTMFADAGHYKYIKDRFLCAGYPQGGRDTCEGDSGGPLMVRKDDVWTLIGTVSHGIKCAEPNLPGVYMKTWSYLPWIYNIIENNDL
ncbi:Carboxypeptidase A2 precursor [Sarcoptes scabiei]|nr:Carboxypeptidase A2 precursor [Sarcoptes scabiei]